jgi:hypothetical protein
MMPASDALTLRKADLQLGSDGSAAGTFEITFGGQEALSHRLSQRQEDEAGRKKHMEELVKGWLPANATIELQNVNSWTSSSLPLVATFKAKLPAFAVVSGRRALLPSSVFAKAHKSPFIVSRRESPVYFRGTFLSREEVNLTVPEKYSIEAMPQPVSEKPPVAELTTEYKNDKNVIHASYLFRMDGVYMEAKHYPALQAFFAYAESTAGQQIVLKAATP